MFDNLMYNPYAWAILSLCTIFSVLFAIFTWLMGKKTKEISVDYVKNDIIKQGKTPIPKLDVKFDEKIIQDLYATAFYIWNSGTDVINADDIVASRKMKIKCSFGDILDARIIKQSDESNGFDISVITSTEVEIKFDYIEGNEGVKIQVLHTGEKSDLLVDCKIKGGKPIRDCKKIKKSKGVKGVWREIRNEMMSSIILIISLFFSGLILQMCGISYKDNEILVFGIAIIIGVIILFVYIKMVRKARTLFHRVIPNKLKD